MPKSEIQLEYNIFYTLYNTGANHFLYSGGLPISVTCRCGSFILDFGY